MELPQHAFRHETEQFRPARRRRKPHQRLSLDAHGRMAPQSAADGTGQCEHVPAGFRAEDRPGDGAAFPAFLETTAGDRLSLDQRGPAWAGVAHLLGPAMRAQRRAQMLLVRLQSETVQMVRCVGNDQHARHPLS